MRKITHIINADRFTAGYINYMKIELQEFKHIFIFLANYVEVNLTDNKDVYQINSYSQLLISHTIRKLLQESDKIIISGVFNIERYYMFLSYDILQKTYLHFWGGDFYQFAGVLSLKKRIQKIIMKKMIGRCASCIYLIDGEAEKLNSIFGCKKRSFVAQMPDNPRDEIDFDKIISGQVFYKHRVLVGNSATPSNCHQEIFETLKKYKNAEHDFEILCPLSYGDEHYKESIIEIGQSMFGKMFIPILKPMSYEEYANLLSSCSVGVFNQKRQQGMGNISTMLYLGKKVYIRDDTSMWSAYKNRGFILHSFNNELARESEVENNLFEISKIEHDHNLCVRNEYLKDRKRVCRRQWLQVLQQVDGKTNK